MTYFLQTIPPFKGQVSAKMGTFRQELPKKGGSYGKNARGVPLHLGVFCPFFSQILVQNGLFIGLCKSNFMGK
jgi:hypothetical protein